MGKNRDRAGLAFGFGLLFGGVAGYFLASDKGRELTSEAGRKMKKVGKDIQEKMSDEMASLTEKMDQVLEHSKSVAENLEVSVKKGTRSTADRVDEAVERSVGNFKKGVDKARKNLDTAK